MLTQLLPQPSVTRLLPPPHQFHELTRIGFCGATLLQIGKQRGAMQALVEFGGFLFEPAGNGAVS